LAKQFWNQLFAVSGFWKLWDTLGGLLPNIKVLEKARTKKGFSSCACFTGGCHLW